MRVLHVLTSVAPRYGGPSTSIWPMAAALNKLDGVHVEVAATDDDGPGQRLSPAQLPEIGGRVRLFPRLNGFLKRSPEMSSWLFAHARDYDVIETHGLWSWPTTAAAAAARRAGVPLVLRPCGMLSPYTWHRGRAKKRAYWWLFERRTVRGAAAFHATSSEEASDIRACGANAPVVNIPLGMEAAAFETSPRSDWLRAQCGPQAGDRPIVLFLSRLHPKKGVADILVPAFASLKTDAFLAIAGGIDHSTPAYADEIRGAIRHYALENRTTMLGEVSPADRWAAFDGASVFCLPSVNENFGIVVIEAMARRCRVVVSDGVAAGTHAIASGAGQVVPRTIEAFAEALDKELKAARNLSQGTGGGYDYVKSHLTWDGAAERLRSLYESVRRR